MADVTPSGSAVVTAAVPSRPCWKPQTSGAVAATVILAAFWVLMVLSLWNKSLTMDEDGDALAGYTYWKYNDYRLRPEHGNLPQRLFALPLVLSRVRPPHIKSQPWVMGDTDSLSHTWMYQTPGNDAATMARLGRATAGLLAVALGVVIWLWSRRLFGPAGGLLSLLLYVLSPTILANGALMTTDMSIALFILASTWSLWALLHRISVTRLIVSALVMGGLFISKMSAVLIAPIALILVTARLMSGRPLPFEIWGAKQLTRRSQQALAFAGAAVFHALVAVAIVWSVYGFRYEAFHQAPSVPAIWDGIFDASTLQPWSGATVKFMREHHVLPEAYIRGSVYLLRMSKAPNAFHAFLNGEFGNSGWKSFFPYTFLVKTPLPTFALIALALAAMARSRQRPAQGIDAPAKTEALIYETLPLWVILAVYWAALISSRVNIGHRYILPTYPPLFVLCGAAALWLGEAGNEQLIPARQKASRIIKPALCALMALLAIEVLYRFPNYLSYFNGLVPPARAYRHLIDSSLDWGQDMPGVKTYIERHQLKGPIYFSYFGSADRIYYKIPANYLHSNQEGWDNYSPIRVIPLPKETAYPSQEISSPLPDYDFIGTIPVNAVTYQVLLKKAPALRLMPGTYFISATMLQPLTYDSAWGPYGPWNKRYEQTYQQLRETMRPLMNDDLSIRGVRLKTIAPNSWSSLFYNFDTFRFARLTAYLRQSREPDDTVNFSILIYHLTDADLARALDGPPPELGPDMFRPEGSSAP